jgi:hypothetical protein
MTAERLVIKPPKQEEHFEHVWEASEALFAETITNTPIVSIIAELQAKLAVYKAISERSTEAEDIAKAKDHLMGNILMTLTKLSLKDNINTFSALKGAIEERKMSQMEASFANTETKSKVESVFNDLKDKVGSSGMAGMLNTLGELINSKIAEETKSD